MLRSTLSAGIAATPRYLKGPRPAGSYRRHSHHRESTVRVMGFINSTQEDLCGRARQYIQTWGSCSIKQLEPLIADHCVFKADGVLYKKDLEGRDAILSACRSSHDQHEHVSYIPVAVAANDEDRVAFAAVAWEFKDKASGSDETCKGVSLKKLTFDSEGRLSRARVCRQMTPGEASSLVKPGMEVHPVDVYQELLPLVHQAAAEVSGKSQDDEAEYHRMKSALLSWVAAWSSDSGEPKALDKVLSPDLKAYDCYGLHGISSSSNHGEGEALSSRKDAEAAVGHVHEAWANRNELLSWAVNQDQRVGFEHWRGHVHTKEEPAGSEKFTLEGLDMVMFDDHCQMKRILKFDMQDYSNQLK